MTPSSFNIRIYGILKKGNQVLVSDELIGGKAVTKFPGGGLELGEGIEECIEREFEEELDISVTMESIYYVNEFYQTSAFDEREQLISIYFMVKQTDAKEIPIAKKAFAFPPHQKQCFRWMEIKKIRQMDIHYPVDQKVVLKLQEEYK